MTGKKHHQPTSENPENTPAHANSEPNKQGAKTKGEIGGPKGLEPTRYGDWEKGGRCFDF